MMIIRLRFVPATFLPTILAAVASLYWEKRWEAEGNSIICCRMRFPATCHPPSLSRSGGERVPQSLPHAITRCDLRLISFTFPEDKLQTHTERLTGSSRRERERAGFSSDSHRVVSFATTSSLLKLKHKLLARRLDARGERLCKHGRLNPRRHNTRRKEGRETRLPRLATPRHVSAGTELLLGT